MDWIQRFNNDEYRNWIAVGSALLFMCDGVRPFLDREMKTFHRRLQAAVGAGIKCRCVYKHHRSNNQWHDMTRCCWARTIQNYCTGNLNKIAWHQSDSSLWQHPDHGPWEIAKLFMSNLGQNGPAVVNANFTDAAGLINLITWCGYIRVPQNLAKDVMETRNSLWAHAPNQKLNNLEKKKAFKSIKNLLQSREFTNDRDAKKNLEKIQALEKADLNTIQQGELRVLKEFKDIIDLEFWKIQDMLNSVNKNLEELVAKQEKNNSESRESFQLFILIFIYQTFLIFCKSPLRKSRTLLLMIFLILSVQHLGNGTLSDSCSFQQSENVTSEEFYFTSSLQVAREHFTGRHWLFRQIEESFEANNSKAGVLITGAPGSGKSALVAQLICSRTSSLFIHNNIIGYHICSYSNKDTQNVVKFVKSLVHMIARRVPKYREEVARNGPLRKQLDHLCLLKPSSCFRKAILDPLKKIEDQNFTVRYIVIDAMDECMPSDTQSSSDILTLIRKNIPSLPGSVKILLTSRPMRRISKLKQFFTIVDIDSADPKNIDDDIDSYITLRGYFKYSSFVTFSPRSVKKLVRQSQGNFLFAREAIQFTLTSPTENYGSLFLPQTLGDIYYEYFERAFPTREEFTLVRPILELLVAATAPLKSTDMFKMIGNEVKFEYFESQLNTLSHFLMFDKLQGTVNLYHKALADWLTSSEIKGELYYVSKEEGCRMLAKYCLKRFNEEQFSVTADIVLQVSHYISCAGMVEKLIAEFNTLRSGKLANLKTAHGSLLHTAALSNDPNVLKLLIHHFNNVDVKDRKGFTPAFLATIHGMHSNLETLYKAGANINVVSYDCAHDATRTLEEQFPKVLNKGKLLRRLDCHSTMLRAAVIRRNVQIVRFLLANDVNMNDETKTESLANALDVAAEIGNLTIVKLLHNARKLNAGSSLRFATHSNRTAVVKYFLESGVQDNCVRCENVFVYSFPESSRRAFYREGHIIDCETSLHIAIRKGLTQLVKLFLIHGGTSLNCPNKNGLLPIHYAVLANNSGLLQLLLNKGDNINEPCHSNISKASFVAKGYRLAKEDMINSANIRPLENDGRFNTSCVCNSIPLHLAARFGFVNILTVLFENGANVSERDCNGSTALHIAACHNQFTVFEKLVDQGADPNVKSFNGSTPFHSAALCAAKDMFIPIRKLGADAYLRDNNGMTVVHYAALYCKSNQTDSEKWFESLLFLVRILNSPEFASASRNDGQTVLHILANCGHYESVKNFLNMESGKKADIDSDI